VCDQETSNTRRLKPATGLKNTTTMGCNARKTNKQTNRNNEKDAVWRNSMGIEKLIKSEGMR
jgi:hypothetical protein